MSPFAVVSGEDDQFLRGELEGAIYPETLPSIRTGSPKVGLVFPDAKQEEMEYF